MSKRRLTPRTPSGNIKQGTRKWRDLRTRLIAQAGGPSRVVCPLCGKVPPTPSHIHLDHVYPSSFADPFGDGIPANELLEPGALRLLCSTCNTSRGNRTDKYVQRRNKKLGRDRNQPSAWNLEPNAKRSEEEANAILMREQAPSGPHSDLPLPGENSRVRTRESSSVLDMAHASTNTSTKLVGGESDEVMA